MEKRFLNTLFISFQIIFVKAQNLVPNPGFETEVSCPANNTFTATSWSSPGNFIFGGQTAHSGSSYSGIGWYGAGSSGWYEYVQAQLSSALVAGQEYNVSMWVTLANDVRKASDDMGIYISNTAICQPSFGPITTVTPQLKFSDGVFMTQTTWQQVNTTYTAAGGEEYITIGCFEPWAKTGKLDVTPGANDRCYYFVDDVSVTIVSALPIKLASFSATLENERNVLIKWETISESNSCLFEIERSVDGINFQKIFTQNGAGNSNFEINYSYIDKKCPSGIVYYRLKQIDCDGKFSYSPISSLKKKQSNNLRIYPNPSKDKVMLSFDQTLDSSLSIKLLNISGETCFELKRNNLNQKQLLLSIESLPKGVYTCIIKCENLNPITKKIIKH